VEVVARRQDSPPKFTEIRYTLHVATDEPERRVQLAHRNLRNYGAVYNTLAAVCDVHEALYHIPAAGGFAGGCAATPTQGRRRVLAVDDKTASVSDSGRSATHSAIATNDRARAATATAVTDSSTTSRWRLPRAFRESTTCSRAWSGPGASAMAAGSCKGAGIPWHGQCASSGR